MKLDNSCCWISESIWSIKCQKWISCETNKSLTAEQLNMLHVNHLMNKLFQLYIYTRIWNTKHFSCYCLGHKWGTQNHTISAVWLKTTIAKCPHQVWMLHEDIHVYSLFIPVALISAPEGSNHCKIRILTLQYNAPWHKCCCDLALYKSIEFNWLHLERVTTG